MFGVQLQEEVWAPWSQWDRKEIQVPRDRNHHGPPSYTPIEVYLKDGNAAFFQADEMGGQQPWTSLKSIIVFKVFKSLT